MTQTLTSFYKKYAVKDNKYSKLKSWLIAGLVFAGIIIVVVSVIIKNSPTKNYAAKNFYFVYAKQCTNRNTATECAEKVSSLGGAGVIYNVGSNLFVITSVYFTKQQADAVAGQIKSTFETSGVLKVSSKALPKSLAKAVHQTPMCKMYYTELYGLSHNLLGWVNQLEKGEIDASKLYKNIMHVKQTITGLSDSLKNSEYDYAQAMYSSSLVAAGHISTFFTSAFSGNSTSKYCHKLCVNAAIEFIDMCSIL